MSVPFDPCGDRGTASSVQPNCVQPPMSQAFIPSIAERLIPSTIPGPTPLNNRYRHSSLSRNRSSRRHSNNHRHSSRRRSNRRHSSCRSPLEQRFCRKTTLQAGLRERGSRCQRENSDTDCPCLVIHLEAPSAFARLRAWFQPENSGARSNERTAVFGSWSTTRPDSRDFHPPRCHVSTLLSTRVESSNPDYAENYEETPCFWQTLRIETNPPRGGNDSDHDSAGKQAPETIFKVTATRKLILFLRPAG